MALGEIVVGLGALLGLGYLYEHGDLNNVLGKFGIPGATGTGSTGTSTSTGTSGSTGTSTSTGTGTSSGSASTGTASDPVSLGRQVASGLGIPAWVGIQFVCYFGRGPASIAELEAWGTVTGFLSRCSHGEQGDQCNGPCQSLSSSQSQLQAALAGLWPSDLSLLPNTTGVQYRWYEDFGGPGKCVGSHYEQCG